MKKYILILFSLLSMSAMAQISLKDDSITYKSAQPDNGRLSTEKFKELNGFSKYSGTIQGFSGYCNFPLDTQKIFYENFMKKIVSLNLTKNEFEAIESSFKQSTYEIKKNGINGLTCDKFKNDFDKIITNIHGKK